MTLAVITLASGRHAHLEGQHEALAASTLSPDSYIVVAMNDPRLLEWSPRRSPAPTVIEVRGEHGALPLAAARNAGARRAIADGADTLVFLDVDCLPTPSLLERYAGAAAEHPDAVLSGAVGYLPEGVDHSTDDLGAVAFFHGFRPRPADGVIAPADARLFWSLSFAVTAATWNRIGGFHESYSGYGGEDTDFAQVARGAGVDFLWVGGAEAFHQFHPTETPPVHHLDDIVRNGALFAYRWGYWPMQGWLEEFEQLGLVARDSAGGWSRTAVSR